MSSPQLPYPEVTQFLHRLDQKPFLWRLYYAFYYRFLFHPYTTILSKSIPNIETLTERLAQLNIVFSANKQIKIPPNSIWVSAHHSLFDALILTALAKSMTGKEPVIVASLVNAGASRTLAQIMIPVSNQTLVRKASGLGLFQAYWSMLVERLSQTEINTMNHLVTDRMAKNVANRPVIVFPDAGVLQNSWFPGIGYALQEVVMKNKKSAIVVPVKLIGTTAHAFMRHGWNFQWNPFAKTHHVSAQIGTPISEAEVKKIVLRYTENENKFPDVKMQAKEITEEIRKIYTSRI